ncbi:unnamed protein product [Pedinophyceae sp. YPF-701]|nr:unnamed protein product [Pedinophyceae sp. YPF-701]
MCAPPRPRRAHPVAEHVRQLGAVTPSSAHSRPAGRAHGTASVQGCVAPPSLIAHGRRRGPAAERTRQPRGAMSDGVPRDEAQAQEARGGDGLSFHARQDSMYEQAQAVATEVERLMRLHDSGSFKSHPLSQTPQASPAPSSNSLLPGPSAGPSRLGLPPVTPLVAEIQAASRAEGAASPASDSAHRTPAGSIGELDGDANAASGTPPRPSLRSFAVEFSEDFSSHSANITPQPSGTLTRFRSDRTIDSIPEHSALVSLSDVSALREPDTPSAGGAVDLSPVVSAEDARPGEEDTPGRVSFDLSPVVRNVSTSGGSPPLLTPRGVDEDARGAPDERRRLAYAAATAAARRIAGEARDARERSSRDGAAASNSGRGGDRTVPVSRAGSYNPAANGDAGPAAGPAAASPLRSRGVHFVEAPRDTGRPAPSRGASGVSATGIPKALDRNTSIRSHAASVKSALTTATEVRMLLDPERSSAEPWQLLHRAALLGRQRAFRQLIERYRLNPLQTSPENGTTAAHCAAQGGHVSILEYIVRANTDSQRRLASAPAHNGTTPLHVAAFCGHLPVVRFLVDACGVSAGVQDHTGSTPFHCAAASPGDASSLLMWLLRAGARHSRTNHAVSPGLATNHEGDTAVHLAARAGNASCLKVLLSECERDDVLLPSGSFGRTLLHEAAANGHPKCVHLVLKWCRDNPAESGGVVPGPGVPQLPNLDNTKYRVIDARDGEGFTPLLCAVRRGNAHPRCSEVCRLLLKAGADASVRAPADGRNVVQAALQLAVQAQARVRERESFVQELESQGMRNTAGRALQHTSTDGSLVDSDVVSRMLVDCLFRCTSRRKNNFDPDAQDPSGETILQMAVAMGRVDLVHVLTRKWGTKGGIRDKSGRTCLHVACKNGQLEVVHHLLVTSTAGVMERTQHEQLTALHIAASDVRHGPKCAELLSTLMRHGAELRALDAQQRTPFHAACAAGNLAAVTLLAEGVGVDVHAKDRAGMTALHMAAQGGHLEIVQYLCLSTDASLRALTDDGKTPVDVAAAAACTAANGSNAVAFRCRQCALFMARLQRRRPHGQAQSPAYAQSMLDEACAMDASFSIQPGDVSLVEGLAPGMTYAASRYARAPAASRTAYSAMPSPVRVAAFVSREEDDDIGRAPTSTLTPTKTASFLRRAADLGLGVEESMRESFDGSPERNGGGYVGNAFLVPDTGFAPRALSRRGTGASYMMELASMGSQSEVGRGYLQQTGNSTAAKTTLANAYSQRTWSPFSIEKSGGVSNGHAAHFTCLKCHGMPTPGVAPARCKKCLKVRYCSKDCLEADKRRHAKECPLL